MPEDQDNQPLGQSITEIIDRTTAIVHEEIELAKAEIAISLQNLLRGSVAGIVGGVFAFFGLFILLIGLSFLIGDAIGAFYPWLGFLIVAFFLFLFGGLLAVFALKNIQKGGSQLTPSQAIDEARQTKDALAKEVQEFDSVAVEEPTPGESKPASDKTADAAKSAEFSPPPAATHPAPDEVAEAKEELRDAREDANAAGVDAKEAKRIAKQEAKEAKEAAKAAAKAEQQAAKAEAIAAKKAKKAEKEAAKAAKKAEKNAAKAAVAGGQQPPTQQPVPPQPPAPPQPPQQGGPPAPTSGQPPIPKPPPPPTGNQPPNIPNGDQ